MAWRVWALKGLICVMTFGSRDLTPFVESPFVESFFVGLDLLLSLLLL